MSLQTNRSFRNLWPTFRVPEGVDIPSWKKKWKKENQCCFLLFDHWGAVQAQIWLVLAQKLLSPLPLPHPLFSPPSFPPSPSVCPSHVVFFCILTSWPHLLERGPELSINLLLSNADTEPGCPLSCRDSGWMDRPTTAWRYASCFKTLSELKHGDKALQSSVNHTLPTVTAFYSQWVIRAEGRYGTCSNFSWGQSTKTTTQWQSTLICSQIKEYWWLSLRISFGLWVCVCVCVCLWVIFPGWFCTLPQLQQLTPYSLPSQTRHTHTHTHTHTRGCYCWSKLQVGVSRCCINHLSIESNKKRL